MNNWDLVLKDYGGRSELYGAESKGVETWRRVLKD